MSFLSKGFCCNFKSAKHVHLFQDLKTLDSEEPKISVEETESLRRETSPGSQPQSASVVYLSLADVTQKNDPAIDIKDIIDAITQPRQPRVPTANPIPPITKIDPLLRKPIEPITKIDPLLRKPANPLTPPVGTRVRKVIWKRPF